MIDKSNDITSAISLIKDGSRVMLGGFGVPGTPFALIEELVRQGPKNLTIIKNDANETGMGVDWLLENGQVKKLIVSHIGLNGRAVQMMNEGTLEVEFVAQGILAERIRIAGAGMLGVVTDIGIDTLLSEGKERVIVGGVTGIIEPAITADFALVHAEKVDTFGNSLYAAAAQNFNPLMAMAADYTIIEAEQIVSPGEISPTDIHTPGPFVDQVVQIQEISEVYGVVKR